MCVSVALLDNIFISGVRSSCDAQAALHLLQAPTLHIHYRKNRCAQVRSALGWLGRVVNRQRDLVVIVARLFYYYLLTHNTYNTELFAKQTRMNGYHGLFSSSLSSSSPCDGLSEPIAVH